MPQNFDVNDIQNIQRNSIVVGTQPYGSGSNYATTAVFNSWMSANHYARMLSETKAGLKVYITDVRYGASRQYVYGERV